MAVDSSLPVGATGESLETVKTAADVHREGVFLGDPITDAARVRIVQAVPDGSQYGIAAYVLGSVTVSNTVAVSGPLTDAQLRASAVPVSVGAIALPTGASTEAKQDAGNASLAAIDSKLGGTLTVTGSVGIAGNVEVVNDVGNPLPVSGTVAVSNFPATQPVSIAGTVAVSGGADHALTFAGDKVDASGSTVTANAGTNLNTSALNLEATQALIKAKTDNLDVALSTRTKPADQQHTILDSGVLTSITNPVAVTGTFFQATQPVSAAALPLPTGAATETTQLLQATEATLAALKAILNLTQGQSGATATGPLMQALVSDTRPSVTDGNIAPLSVNNEGRLRVSMAPFVLEFFGASIPSMTAVPSCTANPW